MEAKSGNDDGRTNYDRASVISMRSRRTLYSRSGNQNRGASIIIISVDRRAGFSGSSFGPHGCSDQALWSA
jgi:hypothetical protein